MTSDCLDILYAEDNPADFLLMQVAFDELGVQHRLHRVVDGDQALSFLQRRGAYSGAPPVSITILDLNLPRKSGLELLRDLAADPSFGGACIVVLTTAARERDVRVAADPLTIHFMTKPMDFEDFVTMVRQILDLAATSG